MSSLLGRASWLFVLLLLPFLSIAQDKDNDEFIKALKERTILQRQLDSIQRLASQVQSEQTLLESKLRDWTMFRDSLISMDKFVAKRTTYSNSLSLAKSDLEDSLRELKQYQARPEFKIYRDSLAKQEKLRRELQAVVDSLRKVSVSKNRDITKDSIYADYVASLKKKVTSISDDRIRLKFEKNIQPVIIQMRESAQSLLQLPSVYDTAAAKLVMALATTIYNNLKLYPGISEQYQSVITIQKALASLHRAARTLTQPYQRKGVLDVLAELQPLPPIDGYNVQVANQEIAVVQNYLEKYCGVNSVFWKSFNEAVNPIPAVTEAMLAELETKIDKRYVYLASSVTAARKLAASGKRVTFQNQKLDPCQ